MSEAVLNSREETKSAKTSCPVTGHDESPLITNGTTATQSQQSSKLDIPNNSDVKQKEINNNEITNHTDNKSHVSLSPEQSLLFRASSPPNDQKRVHRVVFTGGPCAGKTTSMNKIKNFFENIGWKVLIVPETAYTLLSSGIYFYEFNQDSKMKFQENLLKTLLQIEDTINDTARFYSTDCNRNCLVLYDRGAMDPVSYLEPDEWEQLKMKNPSWNEIDLRDNRYDQIVHLVTAANGAEQFYTLANNCTRTETIEVARMLDEKCSKTWCGHPCMDVVDNHQIFDRKISNALQVVCERAGLNIKGFGNENRKRKFLLKSLPDDERFPDFQELNVVHNYLVSNSDSVQVRLRKSGQGGNWAYSYATRTYKDNQMVDTRTQIDRKEYAMLQKTIDRSHWTVYLKRRCFIWRHRYFRVDIYEEPCEPSCRGLILLLTRSSDEDLLLPDFLEIEREVTDDSYYSMFNLSQKSATNKA